MQRKILTPIVVSTYIVKRQLLTNIINPDILADYPARYLGQLPKSLWGYMHQYLASNLTHLKILCHS